MKIDKGLIVLIAASLIFIGFAFAQEQPKEQPAAQEAVTQVPAAAQEQPQQQPVVQETVTQQPAPQEIVPPQAPVVAQEMQWLWGEVVNLDLQNNLILVKYLDYETDQEKEATVSVDEKTTYENIGSIGELNQNDAVSIDYIVTADGKNIARAVSLEKPDETIEIPEEAVKSLEIPEGEVEIPTE